MGIPNQVQMRTCTKCGETKPVGEFSKKHYPWNEDGKVLQGQCKECRNAYFREYRSRDREKYRVLSLDRYHRKVAEDPSYRGLLSSRKKSRDDRNKHDAFMAYGGYVCSCCGETEVMFLSIDHVNNDGYSMRKTHGHSGRFYSWLKRNEYPSGFQILCMNCQTGKARNNGVCPHQERRNDHPVKGVGTSVPKRTAPRKGDDMVCSARKRVAAERRA